MLVMLSVMEQLSSRPRGGSGRLAGERGGPAARVSRQRVHAWLVRYERGGLPRSPIARIDRYLPPPDPCRDRGPDLRAPARAPGMGGHAGSSITSAASASSPFRLDRRIYRCLRRHGLIELRRRRKRRDAFRRWERERPMQLWKMDVMGGVLLDDDTQLKVVTRVDDYSHLCVAAGLVTPISISQARRYVQSSCRGRLSPQPPASLVVHLYAWGASSQLRCQDALPAYQVQWTRLQRASPSVHTM